MIESVEIKIASFYFMYNQKLCALKTFLLQHNMQIKCESFMQ